MPGALGLREGSKLVNEGCGRTPQVLARTQVLSHEVSNHDSTDEGLKRFANPSCRRSRWPFSERSQELRGCPPDPCISDRELNNRTAERSDAHDWVIGPRTVANKEEKFPSRGALVRCCPGMPEVSPNTHEAKPCESAHRAGLNHFNVGRDGSAEGGRALPPLRSQRSTAQRCREFPPIANQREDRVPLPIMKTSTFHVPYEPRH